LHARLHRRTIAVDLIDRLRRRNRGAERFPFPRSCATSASIAAPLSTAATRFSILLATCLSMMPCAGRSQAMSSNPPFLPAGWCNGSGWRKTAHAAPEMIPDFRPAL
jgi:hypothetical protein